MGKFPHGNVDNNKGLVCSGGPVGGGPLYSNLGDYPPYIFDPETQAHLLPLQQYILEQAKLSGNEKCTHPHIHTYKFEFRITPFILDITLASYIGIIC